MGFTEPGFRKPLTRLWMRCNTNQASDLAPTGYFWLPPAISGPGVSQPGQILAKSKRDGWAPWVLSLPFFFLALAARQRQANDLSVASEEMTRPKRRRREERGLPSDEALRELAFTYLETQHRLWPEPVQSNLLPSITDATIAEMIAAFKSQFLDCDGLLKLPSEYSDYQIAASYSRFSDAGSNPRSLAQQLHLQLEKARQNGHFIPWCLVFADAAVTGTTSKRRGYELAKSAVSTLGDSIQALYIDELGRASRDNIESLTLGKLLDDSQKRLIGASDNFDSSSQMAKLMLSMFAMLNEWFIDQLRSKVNRGMDDAFDRGANTGLPAPGYKLVPLLDENGAAKVGRDNAPTMTLAIDDGPAETIRRVFHAYAIDGKSPEDISRQLNSEEFMGSRSWDSSRVRKILRRRTYIGVLTYRTTRQVRNRTTGNVKVHKRPPKEWKVKRARHLRLIPYSLWKMTQQKLASGAAAWSKNRDPKVNRSEIYPKTLVRPICGSCGKPMSLGRSGKYATFTCLNGLYGKHNCQYHGYKSVRIVENTILSAIRTEVFGPNMIDRVVSEANDYLSELSKQPKPDTSKVKKEIKELSQQVERLVDLVAQGVKSSGLGDKITRLEKRIEELRVEKRDLELLSAPVPQSLSRQEVEAALGHLREILESDIAKAAPVLRELTGPIVIQQQREPGKKRPEWIANFTIGVTSVMATIRKDCPTRDIWEYLCTRGWTIEVPLAAPIENLQPYELHSAEVFRLHSQGATLVMIAAKLGVSRGLATAALRFAKTGERPVWGKKNPAKRGVAPATKYKSIAADVALARDVEKLTFADIAIKFACSDQTVRRAYLHARPELIDQTMRSQ